MGFSSIETAINKLSQDIALRLKAISVSYNLDNQSYTYYCSNEITHTFSKLDLTRFLKSEINKRVSGIK